MPENSSERRLTVTSDPVRMLLGSRMQAPDGDVSSMRAGATFAIPVGSCHDTSTSAMSAVRGSTLWPFMFHTIGKAAKDFTGGAKRLAFVIS